MRRVIAVFTGTRAEYGLLLPVLRHLHLAPDVELRLLVGGTHLSAAHGMTVHEIEADGMPVAAKIPMLCGGDTAPDVCANMGMAVSGLGRCLHDLRPDILLVLGDRWETFCAATAASICHIPLAHIHGGEITAGAVDDALRHAITKMSHWHFVTCTEHGQRVQQLGESPDRIWVVGAPGVENALSLPPLPEEDIRVFLGVGQRPYLLCTFHPVTLEPGLECAQLAALLEALDTRQECDVVFTAANADVGGAQINHMLGQWAQSQPQRNHFFASLGMARYLSAARYAACVVGNSSSGVLEIPSLGTPVVNVGNRQQGRVCSPAVLHCKADGADIAHTLAQALAPQHRAFAENACNPHQGENTAHTIAHVLRSFSLKDMLYKTFYTVFPKVTP